MTIVAVGSGSNHYGTRLQPMQGYSRCCLVLFILENLNNRGCLSPSRTQNCLVAYASWLASAGLSHVPRLGPHSQARAATPSGEFKPKILTYFEVQFKHNIVDDKNYSGALKIHQKEWRNSVTNGAGAIFRVKSNDDKSFLYFLLIYWCSLLYSEWQISFVVNGF